MRQMPRALLISFSAALGGAERALIDFSGDPRLESVLACPDGTLARSARDRGLIVYRLAPRSLLLRSSTRTRLEAARALIGHGREARGLIADLDPDVVVACGMRSALACLLGPPVGVPVVFEHNDFLPGAAIAHAVRAAARRAALVIVPSEAVARDLDPRGTLAGRLVVVPPGIEVGPATARPTGPPRALLLGALVAWKRPELALEACALARHRLPDLRLRVVGGSFEGDEAVSGGLRARAQRPDLAGAVDFVGPVPDARAELEQATCLLHCAPREPFGMVVGEALAAGRPAIVPDAAGPAEIVDHTCGRRYAPGDPVAAAQAIVEVAGDPELAAQLGAAGRERVRERFSLGAGRARWTASVEGVARRRDRALADPADVAIVTVTHNSAAELDGLLGSAATHLAGVQVVVVDSGSVDDSVAVAHAAPQSTVIELGRNAGFGAGCNAGVAAVQAPVTVLLNPDVEVLDDSLLELAGLALAPGAPERLLAPLVLNPGGGRQDTVHPRPGSASELLHVAVPPTLLPRWLAGATAPWRSRSARRVGWAVGCALVAPTALLRRLGPFDPAIFLYGEDLDLGLRAAEQGIETWFWPAARVCHLGGHAAERAFGGEPFDLLARGRREVIRRRLGERAAGLDDLAQAAAFGVRMLIKPAAGRSAARERRQLAALWHSREAGGPAHASVADG